MRQFVLVLFGVKIDSKNNNIFRNKYRDDYLSVTIILQESQVKPEIKFAWLAKPPAEVFVNSQLSTERLLVHLSIGYLKRRAEGRATGLSPLSKDIY